jgi:hypothetical protein
MVRARVRVRVIRLRLRTDRVGLKTKTTSFFVSMSPQSIPSCFCVCVCADWVSTPNLFLLFVVVYVPDGTNTPNPKSNHSVVVVGFVSKKKHPRNSCRKLQWRPPRSADKTSRWPLNTVGCSTTSCALPSTRSTRKVSLSFVLCPSFCPFSPCPLSFVSCVLCPLSLLSCALCLFYPCPLSFVLCRLRHCLSDLIFFFWVVVVVLVTRFVRRASNLLCPHSCHCVCAASVGPAQDQCCDCAGRGIDRRDKTRSLTL